MKPKRRLHLFDETMRNMYLRLVYERCCSAELLTPLINNLNSYSFSTIEERLFFPLKYLALIFQKKLKHSR